MDDTDDETKIYCHYCNLLIVGGKIVIVDGYPYHAAHTPEKVQGRKGASMNN